MVGLVLCAGFAALIALSAVVLSDRAPAPIPVPVRIKRR